MEIGRRRRGRANGIDDDDATRSFRDPMLLSVWRGRGRIRAPDYDRGGVPRRAGIEANESSAVHVSESYLPGQVADRVGYDLGRAEPVEEAKRKEERDGGDSARIVCVDDCLGPGRGD